MVIKKLILFKYRRFSLTNIKKLTYTPDTNIQIILGTNGSGKSSLVKELTPLPADIKKDYLEGGYKIIEIEHNNKYYVLNSGIISSGKHSFEIDGIEQNESGIRKIQLQLVYEHFGITPQIHEILLGNVLFTNMSPNDRKKWLSNISNIDYAYSLRVYNNLKQRYRDIVGAIKLTQNKLVQEDLKILSEDDKKRLTYTKEAYVKSVDNLLASKINTTSNITLNIDKIKYTIQQAKTAISKLSDSELTLPELNKHIIEINNTIANYNDRLTSLRKELDVFMKKNDMVNNVIDINTARVNLKHLEDKITTLVKHNLYDIDLNDIEQVYDNYTYINNYFISELNKLNDYSDIYYSKSTIDDIKNKIDNVVSTIETKTNILIKLETDLAHMLKHLKSNDIVCDKCGNTWKQGYDKLKHHQLEQDISKYRIDIEQLKNKHNVLTKLLNKHLEKHKIINTARDLLSNNKLLLPVFRVVIGNNDIQKDTNVIISNSNEATIILSKLLEYVKLAKDRDKLLEEIRLHTANNNINKEHLDNSIKHIENEIHKYIKMISNLKEKLSIYTTQYKSLSNIKEIHNELINNSKSINNNFLYKINELRNNTINEMVTWLRTEISKIEKQLHDSNIVEDRTKIIDKDLCNYREKEKVLKLLVKELSPTEGLIAKSINSFLNVFISEINNIINSVWTYDMVLLPCEVSDDNDLDYKFKVKVNNDEIIDDISKGSSSMQEIINLAFKIVFMKYLGIINTPLILDEFGKTMDPVHRINAYEAINNNLSNIFNQIFIISHFESMYGRFNNVDITILSSDNIDIDKNIDYNKHIVIDYI